jgi:hypothetical protein
MWSWAVDNEGGSDYLILIIYLLFSVCCMRGLYLENPVPQYDSSVYEHSIDDPWELASR